MNFLLVSIVVVLSLQPMVWGQNVTTSGNETATTAAPSGNTNATTAEAKEATTAAPGNATVSSNSSATTAAPGNGNVTVSSNSSVTNGTVGNGTAPANATTKAPVEYQEHSKKLACQFLHGDHLHIHKILRLASEDETPVNKTQFEEVFQRKPGHFNSMAKDANALFCHLDRNEDGVISMSDILVHSEDCTGVKWAFFHIELAEVRHHEKDSKEPKKRLGHGFDQMGLLYTNVMKSEIVAKRSCETKGAQKLSFQEIYAAVSSYCLTESTPGCADLGNPLPSAHEDMAKHWRIFFE